jgi:hypothetical protein
MFLQVANGRVDLIEPENFRAFKVVVDDDAAAIDAARRALAPVGELVDATTAWISESALREWPAVKGNADWQSGFSAMIEKARPHGWIHPTSGAIKAHVEWKKAS